MKQVFRHKKRLANRIVRSGFGFISLALTLALLASATLGLVKDELVSVAVADTATGSEAAYASVADESAKTTALAQTQSDDPDGTSSNEAQPESGEGQALSALSAGSEDTTAEIPANLSASGDGSSDTGTGNPDETETVLGSGNTVNESTVSGEDGDTVNESSTSEEDGEAADESTASEEGDASAEDEDNELEGELPEDGLENAVLPETDEAAVVDSTLNAEEPSDAEPAINAEPELLLGTQAAMNTTVNAPVLLAAADEGEAPVGQDDVVEAYAIPAGIAYIKEIAGSKYTNDTENNAIQNALVDALTYIKSLYDGEGSTAQKEATIVVSEGTYQGGIDLEGKQSGTSLQSILINQILGLNQGNTQSNIKINIVAEDALDENGNATANGDGTARVEGNINIDFKGLDIVLAGLYLSTRGMVNVENADSVTYYGTTQDDVVEMNVSNVTKSVHVDTGKGDDRVTVTAKKKPTVKVEFSVNDSMKSSFDSIKNMTSVPQELQNLVTDVLTNTEAQINDQLSAAPLVLNIDLGLGNDTAKIKLIDSTDLLMGELDANGAITYGLNVDIGAVNATIQGNDGNDRIEVSGGRALSYGQDVIQALVDHISALDKDFRPSTLNVLGGSGDDVVTIDTTTAFAFIGGMDLNVQGNDGFDRLHITGKLNKDAYEDKRITASTVGADVEIAIDALAEITFLRTVLDDMLTVSFKKQFAIAAGGMDAFTDSLLNKRTVLLESGMTPVEAQSFTNYKVVDYGSKVVKDEDPYRTLSLDISDFLIVPEDGLLLTNIVASAEDKEGRIEIEKIQAPDFNLVITGGHIEVTGNVAGKNILLQAIGTDDVVVNGKLSIVSDDLNQENNM
ncbi:MAG: hypothetical protein SPG80_04995, partial [Candidatus Ventricola sp.]|nr:hypothetical protein [Candidatus Ventricola sp.]